MKKPAVAEQIGLERNWPQHVPQSQEKSHKPLEELHLRLAAEGSKNKDTVRCVALGVLEVTGHNEANINCVFVKKTFLH